MRLTEPLLKSLACNMKQQNLSKLTNHMHGYPTLKQYFRNQMRLENLLLQEISNLDYGRKASISNIKVLVCFCGLVFTVSIMLLLEISWRQFTDISAIMSLVDNIVLFY